VVYPGFSLTAEEARCFNSVGFQTARWGRIRGQRADPGVSPLLAPDLSYAHSAPISAELDPLRERVAYAARLRDGSVAGEMRRETGSSMDPQRSTR